jgi:hypothetical protein
MKNAKLIICVVTATLGAITPAQTQAPQASDAVPVTVENFIRAESDLYLSAAQSDAAMLPTGCLLMAQKADSGLQGPSLGSVNTECSRHDEEAKSPHSSRGHFSALCWRL